jgi:hypothetical protein
MSPLSLMRKAFCGSKVYPALNPSAKGASITLSNNNLMASASSNGAVLALTGKSSGKPYYEVYVNSVSSSAEAGLAVGSANTSGFPGSNGGVAGAFGWNSGGFLRWSGATGYAPASYGAGDVLGFAVDLGAMTVDLYKNNVYSMTVNLSSLGVSPAPLYPILGGGGGVMTFRPDPVAMSYAPPSGYSSGWI